LIWAFIEAANFARRFSADAKRFFEKKKAKTNAVVATKALAHKLARASYHILKEKQPLMPSAVSPEGRVKVMADQPKRTGVSHKI
jgi:type IV secretory pathway VirB9-like protein